MNRFVFVFLIIAAMCLEGCKSPDPFLGVSAEIKRTEKGVRVDYALPEPVASFTLNPNDTQQRKDGWTVLGEGFEFDGDTVIQTNGQSFDAVSFDLKREQFFYDRKYVVLDAIGDDSFTVYVTAFRADKQDTRLRFIVTNKDDLVRLGASQLKDSDAFFDLDPDADQMAYFGRAANVYADEAVIVAGPEIPEGFRKPVFETADKTMRKLIVLFAETPAHKPTLYITTGPYKSGWSSKGGMLDESVMSFRYRGLDMNAVDKEFVESVLNTASHEATHLWIGGLHKNLRNEEESWVHEGGTEYLADRTRVDNASIRAEFETRLNLCISRLKTKALDGRDGFIQGSTAYDCGYLLSAFAEAGAVKNEAGNIVDIWKRVFERTAPKGYSPTDFTAVARSFAGPDYAEISNLFMASREDRDWERLPDLAAESGVILEKKSDDKTSFQTLASLWLFPLLAEHCSGSYGYFGNPDHFELDTKKGCAVQISDGPKVNSVNGFNLISEPYKAYLYAKQVCGSGGSLALGLLGGGDTDPIECKSEVLPIPLRFKITGMPELTPL